MYCRIRWMIIFLVVVVVSTNKQWMNDWLKHKQINSQCNQVILRNWNLENKENFPFSKYKYKKNWKFSEFFWNVIHFITLGSFYRWIQLFQSINQSIKIMQSYADYPEKSIVNIIKTITRIKWQMLENKKKNQSSIYIIKW